MTQDRRDELKQRWFSNCSNIRDIRMPSEAKFFVGQVVIHDGEELEIVGYYDYGGGKLPHYLCYQLTGKKKDYILGVPLHLQSEMFLKSEAHLHPRAKIINMWDYPRK